MAVTDTEIEWAEDNVKERLEALCKKDNIWPAVLAARAALREFPLVDIESSFNFPTESARIHNANTGPSTKQTNDSEKKSNPQTQQDQRIRFLLASFFSSHLIIQQARLPIDQRQAEKTDEANAVVASAKDAVGANYAMNSTSAIHTAVIASACVAAYTANAAADAAAFAIKAIDALSVANANAFLQDLGTAESKVLTQSVANLSLWPDKCPIEVEALKDKNFRPAVETIISETTVANGDSAAALAQMLILLEGYFNGTTTTVNENIPEETIYEALTKLTAEDANGNKDSLNRGALVSGLADIICDDEHIQSLTIGVMGHWGSGKTQVLELLKKEINSRDCQQPFLFGEFNAWTYEHAKNSQAAMAHEVISALTSCDWLLTVDTKSNFLVRLSQSVLNHFLKLIWIISVRLRLICGFAIQKHFSKVLQTIVWLVLLLTASSWLAVNGLSQNQLPDFSKPLTSGALLAIIASLWQLPKRLRDIISQPMTKEFLTYIKLPNYASHIGEITEMQKDIRLMANLRLGFAEEPSYDHLLKISKPRRLLFIVDDLDRCSPEGIVKTFEAIRLVLNIPHVTVVVAVDQRIALAALALHYNSIAPYHTQKDARAIARDYFAKMIQLPIVVSDGDDESLIEFLSDIWQEEGDKKRNWLTHLFEEKEGHISNLLLGKEVTNDESPKRHKQGADSHTDDKMLTETEIAKLILEGDPKPSGTQQEVLPGLSDHQKAALYFWATRFGLSNARQLKRLDNSYNLVRLVTDEEDKLALTKTSNIVNKQHVKFSYGYLVALMTLEFINSIEVTTLRENASRFLRKGDVDKLNCMANQQHKATLMAARSIIQNAAEQLYPKTANNLHFDKLLRYIENFALPAIDGFDIDTETASSNQPKSVEVAQHINYK